MVEYRLFEFMKHAFPICVASSFDLTFARLKRILVLMERISTQKNSFLKRLLINIPFVLIVALDAICFFAGVVAIFYCVVTGVAFKSAMISLILLGAGFILLGAGLGLIIGFKRYYAFYDKKMGWVYPNRKQPEEKTSVQEKKPLKAYFTLSNVALAFLLVGAIFTVVSAALGSISRDKWVEAVGPYRESHGYLKDVERVELAFSVEDAGTHAYTLQEIDVDLLSKQAVIIFTDDKDKLGLLTVEAYVSYKGQLSFANDKQPITYFTVKETPPPVSSTSAIDKLLFFADDVLKSVPSEKQIKIYLPLALKDKVIIDGEHIVAKTAK